MDDLKAELEKQGRETGADMAGTQVGEAPAAKKRRGPKRAASASSLPAVPELQNPSIHFIPHIKILEECFIFHLTQFENVNHCHLHLF